MSEQQLFRSPPSATITGPAQQPKQTGIEIHWGETVARAIKIRQSYVDAARKANLIRMQRTCRQRHDVLLALVAEAQENFASRLAGTMQMESNAKTRRCRDAGENRAVRGQDGVTQW